MRTPGQILHGVDGQRVEPRVALPAEAVTIPLSGAIDDADSLLDVVDLLALSAFATGHQPYARAKVLQNVRADATLLPPQAQLVRDAADDSGHVRLAASPAEGATGLYL